MFQHNLLLIYRNFKRFKGTFFINLIGLSTGLACTILIYLWVSDEESIDKFHANDANLYQVYEHRVKADGIWTAYSSPGLMASSLAAEMPEVEYATSTTMPRDFQLSIGDKNFKASGLFAAQDFFKMFSYDLIHGNAGLVL